MAYFPYNCTEWLKPMECTTSKYTSAKIIQLNEWGCRDGMHRVKNRGDKEIPLAILSRILAQSCITLYLTLMGRCYDAGTLYG